MNHASPTTAPAAPARGTGGTPAGSSSRQVMDMVSSAKSSPETSPAAPAETPPNTYTSVTAREPPPKLAATCPARAAGATPRICGATQLLSARSMTCTSSSRRPRLSSPPNTTIFAPASPRTSVAVCPPRAGGAGPRSARRRHSLVSVSSTHASSFGAAASAFSRARAAAAAPCAAAASSWYPPTTTTLVPHETAAWPDRAGNEARGASPPSSAATLASTLRQVRFGRCSAKTSPRRLPPAFPPMTNTSSPTVAMACAYLPLGLCAPPICFVSVVHAPSSASMRSTAGCERDATASARLRRSAASRSRSRDAASSDSAPAAATASAAASSTSATRAGSPPSVNSENQSGFSSSIVLTYIRIASIAAVSPSCVQLLHLALSMAFQPQGLGARHGPAVACWYSA
mmetsp:Transcript_5947/g.25293  ORF Transcript_5947/g.25293 Transcript_5947/m.25293 type:complete len:402 (+) Transcript_5947:738-1943(+)